MTPDRLDLLAAKAAINLAAPEDLRSAAIALLEAGFDSPALRELAGLSPLELHEAQELLVRALADLRVPIPSAREAMMCVAREIATEIVEGTVAPDEGAKRIWELTLQVSDEQSPELDSFVYAASEWDDRPEDRRHFRKGIMLAARDLLDR